jgi:hypothetical protein
MNLKCALSNSGLIFCNQTNIFKIAVSVGQCLISTSGKNWEVGGAETNLKCALSNSGLIFYNQTITFQNSSNSRTMPNLN